MRAKKVNIYLNPDKQSHAKVLAYLENADVSTTEAVVTAVLSYLQATPNSAMLIEAVKSTISACMSQQVTVKVGPATEEPAQSPANNQAVNDFLAYFKK